MFDLAIGLKRKPKAFTGAQTNAAVWTPASGKCIVLIAVYIITSAAADVTLFIGTNAEANLLPGSGSYAANSGIIHTLPPEKFAADAVLKLTTSAGNATVIAYGYEESP